jgi:protein SCO1/2
MRIKIIFTLLVLLLFAGCLQEKFSGIAPNPYPAPEFTLTNQFGEQVSLSDFRGKVVVMSFLYTGCPTVCPLTTSKFAEVAKVLGDAAGKEVIFIAVSVDPEGDTVAKVKGFVDEKGLGGKMHYLTGNRGELEGVWDHYNVYVNKSEADAAGNYNIAHTAIVYVIDKKGNLRLLYPGLQWYPKFLVGDVKTLLREEGFLYRLLYDIP